MDIKTIKTQPDKAVISTPVTGVLTEVYPQESTSHPQYGDGTRQNAKLSQGQEFIFVEFKNFPQDMESSKGKQVTLEASTSQHGLNGVKVNRYYSEKAGAERINLRVTSSANVTVSGGATQGSHAPTQGTSGASQPTTNGCLSGPLVGAAINNACAMLIAEGNTGGFAKELYAKASAIVKVSLHLQAGNLHGVKKEAAPPPPPPPPVVQAPPPPVEDDPLDEDVPF